MYTTNNTLLEQDFKKLQVKQLVRTQTYEILSISLEADHILPEHVSPRDAHLLLLEGEIYFGIDNQIFNLKAHQVFHFEADKKHFVKALTNSKFLIIR